jgi:hypothetical protein
MENKNRLNKIYYISGVCWRLFFIQISAPLLKSISTHVKKPLDAAKCNGVSPFLHYFLIIFYF